MQVHPSSDTTVLVAAAERGMRKIYQPDYRLAKAGVMLLDLSPQTRDQPPLLPKETAPTGRDNNAFIAPTSAEATTTPRALLQSATEDFYKCGNTMHSAINYLFTTALNNFN